MEKRLNVPDAGVALDSGSPRYQQIADDLLTRIQSGAIPLGEIFQSEADLCNQYSASRGTVRKSLEQLQGLGVIMRRQREGTRVVSRFPSLGKLDNKLVLEDWARYGVNFPLTIESITQRTPPNAGFDRRDRREMAVHRRPAVSCRVPHPRFPTARSYVHPDFSEIRSSLSRTSIPIYAQIEQKYGRTISAVRAMLRATSLPEPIARKLDAAANSPTLELTATTWDSRRVIAVSTNMHPADRYAHIIEVQRTS